MALQAHKPVSSNYSLDFISTDSATKTPPTLIQPFDPPPISLSAEAQAYELLWNAHEATYKTVHERFKGNDYLPSRFVHPDDLFEEAAIAEMLAEKRPAVMCRTRPQFSEAFNDMRYPLALFYYEGNIDATLHDKIVSIVGTRNPTAQGIENTRTITQYLVSQGYIIVSGLAKGIDTIALETAIEHDGQVIAVIGTPIDECYPRDNKPLQDKIRDRHTLISHVPFYHYHKQPFPGRKYYFTERNAIMAALSHATIITEMSDTSGTRSQASECIYMNRPLYILRESANTVSWATNYIQEQKAVAINYLSDIKTCFGPQAKTHI